MKLKVHTPKGWKVAATGEKVTIVRGKDGDTHIFRASAVRDLAVVAGLDYLEEGLEVDGVSLSVHYLETETQVETVRETLDLASEALRFYSEQFGTYPYTDLVIVLHPFFDTSSTERPGFITLGYKAGDGKLARVIYRGVARQWWYGIVGNDALLEPWLSEALGEYSALLLLEDKDGREAAEQILKGYLNDVQRIEAGQGRSYAVGSPLTVFPDHEAYQAIVLGKGVLFLDTLRRDVGAQAFMDGLRQYAQWYWYGEGSGQGLLEAMQAASGKDLLPLFVEWVGVESFR
jgi:aminopeptidase N